MAKKKKKKKSSGIISGIVVILLCGGIAAIGLKFAKDMGAFEKYPEPTYLSEEEVITRPIYLQLSDYEQSVYTCLLENVSQTHESEIKLPYEITGDIYSKLYCILEKQEGNLFYIDSSYYTADTLKKANIVYRETQDIDQMIQNFENAKQTALAGMPESDDDYEKALYIHDYIIKNSQYISDGGGEFSSTAYGCLVEGAANCEGYAKAFDVLANECGLQSILITGVTDKGENHAWNQVNVNGSWYNLDSTWDDVSDTDIRRVYFLCDDLNFGRTHYQKNLVFTPFSCDETKDNYYVREDLYATTADEAEWIVLRELEKGNYKIPLRFKDSYVYEDFKQYYINEQNLFEIIYNLEERESGTISINLTETRSEHCMTIIIEK